MNSDNTFHSYFVLSINFKSGTKATADARFKERGDIVFRI